MLVHLIYVGARPKNVAPAILEQINQGIINESGKFVAGPFWIPV